MIGMISRYYDPLICHVWYQKNYSCRDGIAYVFDGIGCIYEADRLCTFTQWNSSYYSRYRNVSRCKYFDF